MAQPTVGDGISRGLLTGIALANSFADRKTLAERTAKADALAEEERTRSRARQERADQGVALNNQLQGIQTQAERTADPAERQTLGLQAQAIQQRQQEAAAAAGGVDLDGIRQQATATLDDVRAGRPAAPGRVASLLTVQLGTDPKRLLRSTPDGISPYEEDMGKFLDAVQKGDHDQVVSAGNSLFAGELHRNVGKPAIVGGKNVGTYVGQKIVGVVADPNSPPDDPRFMLTVRNYVKGGKDFNGPREDGTPDGATGHYDSPITLNRTSDPNDPVRGVSMKELQESLATKHAMVEWANSPEGRALVEADLKTKAFNPESYLKPYSRKETKTEYKDIPKRGFLKITKDAAGNVIGEETINPPATGGAGQPASVQLAEWKLDQIENDDSLSDQEKKVQKRSVLAGIKPGKYTGDGGGAGGGKGGGAGAGAGGSGSLTAGENRLVQRQLETTKADLDDMKAAVDDAEKKYQRTIGREPGDFADAATRKAWEAKEKAAKAVWDSEVSELATRRKELMTRRKTLEEKLDAADKPAPAGASGTAKPGIAPAGGFSSLWK